MTRLCFFDTKEVEQFQSFSFFLFFFSRFIYFYWKGGYTERRDREEDLMIHSPSERNGSILCRSEARSLFRVSHAGAGGCSFPELWAVLCCFPRPQARSWKGSGAAGSRTGAHMGSRACKARTFNHLRHRAGPTPSGF